jgi:hypothetical protein
MKTNLGQALAQLIRNETDRSTASAIEKARQQSADEVAKVNEVQQFFKSYQQFVVECISQGKPSKDLSIIVGNTGIGTGHNLAVYNLLQMDNDCSMHRQPKVTTPEHVHYHLWKDFLDWAATEGLLPVWKHQYNGAGISAWYTLSVVSLP